MRVKTLGAVTCAWALTFAAWGHAEEPDEATKTAARALGAAGVEELQKGNGAAASDKLEKAYGLLKVPSLALWSARALVKRGLLVEATERYLEGSNLQAPSGDSTVQRKSQADARTELAALKPKVPSVVIQLAGTDLAEVTITLDGEQLAASWVGQPRLVNPGTHHIVAQRGADKVEGSATVAESESKLIELKFTDAPVTAAPSVPAGSSVSPLVEPAEANSHHSASAQRAIAWVALGVGAAGVAFGGVTGIVAAGKKSDLNNSHECQGSRCPTSQTDTVNGLNSMRTLSSVGFIAGGVLAGTGLVLLLSSKASSESGATHAFVTPTSFTLRRDF